MNAEDGSRRLDMDDYDSVELSRSIGEDAWPLDNASPTPVLRLGSQLLEKFGFEVPVYYWPAAPRSLVRAPAQAYNHLEQYARLAETLEMLLDANG
ncbi:MAG: hypothetical protein KJZ87_25630 [Thermoguttaceae bacterium]|nr:hypothetical protein [Thermoguttaceae bacterium]